MPKYSYQIQTNNKNLSEFAFGDNWLIGNTSLNSSELNKRLKIHLKNDRIDENAIKKTISEFIEWYKKDYENKENEPCQDEEYEIVSGIGIAKFADSGSASLFCLGSFNFYLSSSPNAEIKKASIILHPNEKLIADPKKANVADKIKFYEERIDGSYNFPFAVIQTILFQEPTLPRPSFLKYIFSGVFVIGLLVLGWFDQERITSLFSNDYDSALLAADSVDHDVTTIINDSMMAETDTTKYPIDYIVDKGKLTLIDVKELMNKGINSSAIQKLDSLEIFVTRMTTFNYDHKKGLYDLLNEISLLKNTLYSTNEFTADTTKK